MTHLLPMPPPEEANSIVTIAVAALSAGTLKYIFDAGRGYFASKRRPAPNIEARRDEVDASILTVARARDELEADNASLRATLADERQQSVTDRAAQASERQAWAAERLAMQNAIATLEAQIRQERVESDRRYASLLEQVTTLRTRNDSGIDQ